jgi:hypothetical protein
VTAKERVQAAIERKPVDRIPLGFYVVDCDTVGRVLGRKTLVRDKVGAQIALWEGRREEVVESYKKDTVEFYQKIDCADLITFKEAPVVPPKDALVDPPRRVDDETWEDRDGRIFKISRLSNEILCVHDPTLPTPEDLREEDFPEYDDSEFHPPDASQFEACDYIVEHLGANRYIAGNSGGIVALTLPGGTTTGLMLYALKPEVIRAANKRLTHQQNLYDAYYIRPRQDGVLLEQDMAGSNGPLISPAQFRENCLPYMKERIRKVRSCGCQIILHNCGDNRPLMDMFIEAGVQCYQSLQTNAGMDVGWLQDHFGHALAFWGGVSVELLVSGTPDEVRQSVREAMDKGRRGPGFILGPSHSIAFGTKYDNFMAMLDEYDKLADQA